MSRKLIVICANHWAPQRTRSNQRPVLDNAQLLGRWLKSETATGDKQLLFMDKACKDRKSSNFLSRGLSLCSTKADILSAYTFLVENYHEGDEIFLFGAGRGGYIARKLATILDQIGLLEDRDINNFNRLLSRHFPSDVTVGEHRGNQPDTRYSSRRVRIRLLGCWDTVGHNGLPMTGLKTLSSPFIRFESSEISSIVEHACQALAIDEERKSHDPAIWTVAADADQTTLRQVWFAGSHQNITGGLPNSQLSDIPLLWMINNAKNLGLAFDEDQVLMESNADSFGKITVAPPQNPLKSWVSRYLAAPRPIGMANSHFNRAGMLETEKLHSSVSQRIKSQFIDYSPRTLNNLISGELPIEQESSDLYVNARQYVRQPVDWPATLICNDNKMNCNLLDLSNGGAKIWFSGQLNVGTSLTLRTPMNLIQGTRGKIVWQQDNMFGLEFHTPTNLHKRA